MKSAKPIQIANTFWKRLKGLMGEKNIYPFFIPDCAAIHTFWMKQSLDVFWVNENLEIIKIKKNIKPQKFIFCSKAKHVLEAPVGFYKNLKIGDKVAVDFNLNKNIVQNESGQALVEAAFILPVLLILIFGFIQLGLAIHELQKLNYTANYATQVGSLTNNDLKITGAVAEFYSPGDITTSIESLKFSDSSAINNSDRRYGDVVLVQLIKPFNLQIPFFTLSVVNLQAEAHARVLCQNTVVPYTCL